MKLTKKMCKILADLEYLIGSECYNPNSYDGWQNIDGCDYRYPISVPDKEGIYHKTRNKIYDNYKFPPKNIDSDTIRFMKYKFGSNELFIGKGLIKVLSYLEERYDIDFWELEKNRNKK